MGVSKTWALRFGLCAAVVYLAIQAMGGRQGMLSLMALKERQHALTLQLAALKSDNATLEHRAAQFSMATLDRAAVAERARIMLGYGPMPAQFAALAHFESAPSQ